MLAIGDWVKVLIVVVLLGNLVEFILPKGDMKRYGGLVVGLVILATIITPLWGFLHQVHSAGVFSTNEGWTNTSSGYSQVVSLEELHQAEAIVLSMPHIETCQLTLADNGSVHALVQTTASSVSRQDVSRYVTAALGVTMGTAPKIQLSVHQVGRGSGGNVPTKVGQIGG